MRGILIAIVLLQCTIVAFVQAQGYCQNGEITDGFNVSPSEVVVQTGGSASITCRYSSAPSGEVLWGVVRGGVPSYLFNGTNDILMVPDSKTLRFNNVEQIHAASYYCFVAISQTEEECSQLVPLTILHPPVIINQDKPMGIAILEYNLTVRREAVLNLITSGNPPPETVLFKKMDGKYVRFTSERFTVNLRGITISSVETEDVGDYRLTATYDVHYDEEEFMITVNIPPVPPALDLEVLSGTASDDDDTRVLAQVGSRVSIACIMIEAYTEGGLQVHWSTDSQLSDFSTVKQSTTEVHLSIDSATREHSGRYTCHAINNEGTTSEAVNIVVGTVPEKLRINVTSSNNTLIVMWQQSTTEDHDQRITAHYIQYISINNSNNIAAVEKFAASVQLVTLRNVVRNVQYLVTMWSENPFGNGTESDSVFVVIAGPVVTTEPSTSPPTTAEAAGNTSDDSSDAAVIGTVVGVCFLVAIVFCVVVIALLILYLSNRRAQGQQQWQKDPEFQSQLSLSAGSVRVPHIPPSDSMPAPVPLYATPFLNTNGFSSSSISKRSSEDNNWQIPRDNIQLSELLAEGEHTVLYRATVFGMGKFKKTTEVTVKQVKDNNSSPEEVKVLIEEMDLMQDLGIHPNVVNVLAVCTVGDPVYLIMDYFAHGDLLGFLRATRGHTEHYTVSAGTETKVPSCSVQPQDLLSLASQVANGMSFLEEKKVAHRSLCARNVLVGTGLQIKIYNYGQKNDDQSSYAKWMAPETLFDGTANATSDVWSFGVTLWEIVTIGGSPYFQMRPEDMRKVLEDGYRMPNPDHCSEEIYKVMQDCWEYDPQDRPGFDLISYRLETLSKTKLSYIDLKLYDEVLYSQFEDTPQLCTAL